MDFSQYRILIVGDVMLDKYYFGKVERISPEAPVPVVNIVSEESRLGGAANVANNINSLGGNTLLCGAIGHDFFGKEVERLAKQKHIHTLFLKTEMPTITKARIIGGRQQIVRIDYEQKTEPTSKDSSRLQQQITEQLPHINLIIISDYGKGFITDSLCSFIIQKAQILQIPVIVDPKGIAWHKYTGANLITPNVKELSDIIGHPLNNNNTDIESAGKEILNRFKLAALLVTRSEKGMSLILPNQTQHIPTHSQEVFDVSGAGDTVVAALALALASGKNITEAIKIANIAAGIVVRKIGTATLTIEELEKESADLL